MVFAEKLVSLNQSWHKRPIFKNKIKDWPQIITQNQASVTPDLTPQNLLLPRGNLDLYMHFRSFALPTLDRLNFLSIQVKIFKPASYEYCQAMRPFHMHWVEQSFALYEKRRYFKTFAIRDHSIFKDAFGQLKLCKSSMGGTHNLQGKECRRTNNLYVLSDLISKRKSWVEHAVFHRLQFVPDNCTAWPVPQIWNQLVVTLHHPGAQLLNSSGQNKTGKTEHKVFGALNSNNLGVKIIPVDLWWRVHV